MRIHLNSLPFIGGGLLAFVFSLGLTTSAQSSPTTLTVSGTIAAVEGSYVGAFAAGQSFTGSFTYDTDENNAAPGAITTPSTVPGHEFASFPGRGRVPPRRLVEGMYASGGRENPS